MGGSQEPREPLQGSLGFLDVCVCVRGENTWLVKDADLELRPKGQAFPFLKLFLNLFTFFEGFKYTLFLQHAIF